MNLMVKTVVIILSSNIIHHLEMYERRTLSMEAMYWFSRLQTDTFIVGCDYDGLQV